MNFLFIHQNFPGQFKHLAPALAAQGHNVIALGMEIKEPTKWRGVQVFPYRVVRKGNRDAHPWLGDLNTKMLRAEAALLACRTLRERGFTPDVIIAHPGWGETLFVKDIFPKARLGLFAELYYSTEFPHVGFDPEFPPANAELEPARLRMRNLYNHIAFAPANGAICPTQFQASTFPPALREKITISFDGVDTDLLVPDPTVRFPLDDGTEITRDDEIITFVNRNLEPYRGYHVFMRALPRLLRERPNAKVLVVGGDGASYGPPAPDGKTWKQIYIDEMRSKIPDEDWARVHWLGRIPYDRFVKLLQVSRVHIYLTYPFVLSWSLFETMSTEGAVVAADVAPVRELVTHGETGRLVGFFDGNALVDEASRLLDDPDERERLGKAARAHVVANYDLKRVCLPRQLAWVKQIAESEPVPPGSPCA